MIISIMTVILEGAVPAKAQNGHCQHTNCPSPVLGSQRSKSDRNARQHHSAKLGLELKSQLVQGIRPIKRRQGTMESRLMSDNNREDPL